MIPWPSAFLILLTGLVAGGAIGFLLGVVRSRVTWHRHTRGRSVITGADLAQLLGLLREIGTEARSYSQAALVAKAVSLLEEMPLAGTVPSAWDSKWARP